ncbi:MAG: thiamine phosphate synthase [Bacteroidales bacterium]
MELIVISPETIIQDEANVICMLLEAGVQRYHIRKPNTLPEHIFTLMDKIPSDYHHLISLHYYTQLLESFPEIGLHISGNLNTHDRNKVLERASVKSASCHTFKECVDLDNKIDYSFLSPVYSSISKDGYCPKYTQSEFQTFLSQPRKSKIIALGGVEASNKSIVKAMGFDGIAIMGYLWKNSSLNLKVLESRCKSLLV